MNSSAAIILSMNVGQLSEVKLFDKPPSKKLGNGLDEAVAIVDELDVWVDVVADDGSEFVVDVPVFVVELCSVVDVAVDIVISNVVVTESSAVSALLCKSWSLGCNIVHTAASMYGTRVSSRSCSSSSSSKTGAAVCFGFRYQISSSGARSRSATAVGSGSSSTWYAIATDANEIARPSVVAHGARVTCFDVAEATKRLAEAAWWRRNRSERGLKRAIVIMLQPQNTCGSCTASR